MFVLTEGKGTVGSVMVFGLTRRKGVLLDVVKFIFLTSETRTH